MRGDQERSEKEEEKGRMKIKRISEEGNTGVTNCEVQKESKSAASPSRGPNTIKQINHSSGHFLLKVFQCRVKRSSRKDNY